MTLPAKTPKTQALTKEEADNFKDYAAEGGDLLERIKFKRDKWIRTQDDSEIPPDEQFVINLTALWREWTKWKGQEPVDRKVVPVASGEPFPDRDEMGDLDQALWETDGDGNPRDPWQEQHGFTMRSLKSGEESACSFSSDGGKRAVRKLAGIFEFQTSAAGEPMFPRVLLKHKTYIHPIHNVEVGKPVFAVQDWTTMENLLNDKIPF